MELKNIVIYDFETSSANSNTAYPLQLGFMIIPSTSLPVYKKSLSIKFTKPFLNCTKEEISGLNFNKIYSQEDLDLHNQKSINLEDALQIFIKSIQTILKFQEFTLIGFNNFLFDNKILNRLITKYYSEDLYYLLNDSYDVLQFLNHVRKFNDIPGSIWNKYFATQNKKLETMYQHIFQEEFRAHDALEDVRATYKLLLFFAKKFPAHLKNDMNNTFTSIDVNKSDLEFKSANEVLSNV